MTQILQRLFNALLLRALRTPAIQDAARTAVTNSMRRVPDTGYRMAGTSDTEMADTLRRCATTLATSVHGPL